MKITQIAVLLAILCLASETNVVSAQRGQKKDRKGDKKRYGKF